MANNRMALVCVCGGYIIIGKRMGSGYYNAPSRERIDAFYDRHELCAGETWPDTFHLAYEIPAAGQAESPNRPPDA